MFADEVRSDSEDEGDGSDEEGDAGGHRSGRRGLYRELRAVLLAFSDLCNRNLARERRRRRAAETAARGFA